MDYYIRAFCLAKEVPQLESMLQWLAERDVRLTADTADDRAQLKKPDWQRVALSYRPGRAPIILECHRNGDEKSDARRTIEEFLEKVGSPGKSTIKPRVVAHLKGTSFIIAFNLPVDDMDDEAWDANGQMLTFLVENAHALIQADREGFYERANLILKLE